MTNPLFSINLDKDSSTVQATSLHQTSGSHKEITLPSIPHPSGESTSGANLANKTISVIPAASSSHCGDFQRLQKLANDPTISPAEYDKILTTFKFQKDRTASLESTAISTLGTNHLSRNDSLELSLKCSKNQTLKTYTNPGKSRNQLLPPITKTTPSKKSSKTSTSSSATQSRLLSDQQIIFIKALKTTAEIGSKTFKEVLRELDYTGSFKNTALGLFNKTIFKQLQKLTVTEKQLLKTHGITESDVKKLIESYLKKTSEKKAKPVTHFGKLETTFIKVLTEADFSFDALRQALANTQYAQASDNALRIKKSRILQALKDLGESEIESEILSDKGITQDQIDQLLSQFTHCDIMFLRTLPIDKYQKKVNLNELSKALQDSNYPESTSSSSLTLKKFRLIKSFNSGLSQYDKRYLSAQGITQDHIDMLLFKFTPSDINFLKDLSKVGSPPSKKLNKKGRRLLTKLRDLNERDKKMLSENGIFEEDIKNLLS